MLQVLQRQVRRLQILLQLVRLVIKRGCRWTTLVLALLFEELGVGHQIFILAGCCCLLHCGSCGGGGGGGQILLARDEYVAWVVITVLGHGQLRRDEILGLLLLRRSRGSSGAMSDRYLTVAMLLDLNLLLGGGRRCGSSLGRVLSTNQVPSLTLAQTHNLGLLLLSELLLLLLLLKEYLLLLQVLLRMEVLMMMVLLVSQLATSYLVLSRARYTAIRKDS